MEINKKNCKNLFCKLKIHSSSQFNKEALNLKKEARNKGITEFEKYPKYVEWIQCKSQIDDDEYPSENECYPSAKKATSPQKSKQTNTQKRTRCPNEFRYNKKTGMCEAKI